MSSHHFKHLLRTSNHVALEEKRFEVNDALMAVAQPAQFPAGDLPMIELAGTSQQGAKQLTARSSRLKSMGVGK